MSSTYPRPELSIVVCAFNEQGHVPRFLEELKETLAQIQPKGYEIIIVDDGSTDRTWLEIQDASLENREVRGIRLLRNAGKENALTAGLAAARGQAHIPLDIDLQDPPEVVVSLVQAWRSGAPSVLARRERRDDGVIRNVGARLVYKVLEMAEDVSIPPNIGDFRLLDDGTTQRFLKLHERSRYNKGLFSLVSPADSLIVDYERPQGRLDDSGGPRQNLRKLVQLTISGITAFTTWPLNLLSAIGFLLVFVSLILGTLGILLRAIGLLEVPGQATVVLLFAFLLGFQALSTGILGLYIGQILKEVKNRPLFSLLDECGLDSIAQTRVVEIGHGRDPRAWVQAQDPEKAPPVT